MYDDIQPKSTVNFYIFPKKYR